MSYKVIIVGCGNISRVWIKECMAIDGIEIVGLVDLSPEAVQRTKDHFGLECKNWGDLEQAIRESEADVVIDVTVPQAHLEVGLTALNNGCHLWSEKPMAQTMDAAQQLVEAARMNNRIHAVMQNRRHLSSIQATHGHLWAGDLGAISTLNADFYLGIHFSGPGRNHGERDFRDSMEHVLLLDMAIHTFDQARYLLGSDPVSVICHEYNPRESWYDHGASAMAIFEMSDGSVFNYRGSWSAKGRQTSWHAEWHAICENGSLDWDGQEKLVKERFNGEPGFQEHSDRTELPEPTAIEHESHGGWIREVVKAMDEGRTPHTVGYDNIKSLAMVHGAIESAEKGQRIDISKRYEHAFH